MTKRRFVKLLMSQGNSRNESVVIALRYNRRNYSYEKAYSDYLIKYALSNSFRKFGLSCEEASKSFAKLFNVLSEFKTD